MFSQSPYTVYESDGFALIELVLQGASSTDVTIEVYTTDGLATGEYCSGLINY